MRSALLISLLFAASARAEKPTFLHTAPKDWPAGQVLQVDGSLAGGPFEKLVVRYRGPGEEYVDVKMELQYGDLYRGTIPAARMRAPGIEYYVEGISEAGERTAIFMTAAKPARVLVMADDGTGAKPPPPEPKEEPKPVEIIKDTDVKRPPRRKCKKNDKKCIAEQAALDRQEKADKEKAKKEEAAKKEEPPPPAPPPPEPKKEEPVKKDEPKKEEPAPPPPVAKKEEPEPPPAAKKEPEPPRKKSELEEELAIYGAEDATGVVTRVDERATRVAQSVTTYDAAALRQLGARTVYDVLDLMPGLTVSRDVQGFHRVAVRAIRSDAEVLFLLDGHPLNNLYDGRALANLPIANLEKIEVVRGPATADVALGNFLAVVNLVTRRDDGVRVSAGGGIWETIDGHLDVAKTFGGLRLFLDGDVVRQLGYRKAVLKDALDVSTIAQMKRTAADPAGTTRDGRLLVSAGAGAEYAREGLGTISLQARFLLESRDALIGQYDTLGNDSKLDWNALFVDLAYARKLGEASKLQIRLFFDQQATRRKFQLSPRNYQVGMVNFEEGLIEEISTTTRNFGGEVKAELALPLNNRLTLGLEGGLGSLAGYDYLANYEPGTNAYRGPGLVRPTGLVYPTEANGVANRFHVGLHVQDVFTPFERLSIQLGVRADLLPLPGGVAFGIGPRAGLVFAPINPLALKASYGRAFRPPTVQELAETIPNSDSNQGRLIGNGALQPAYVDSVEAGFEYAQTLGETRIRLKASGFFDNFTNPIMPVDSSGNLVPYTNRQQGVRVFGAEGEARAELSQRSAVFVNASFFRAEDNATVPAARLLTDTPQARVNAGFSLPIGPYLNFDVTTRFGSERRNNSRSVLELLRRYRLPGYFVVGAALRTEPLFDHVELGVLGQNVFDFDYADDVPRPDRITAGVPREGFSVFGTVKVEF